MKAVQNVENHFHYVDQILESFCKELKLTISKASVKEQIPKVSKQIFGFKFKWKKAKIPFNRGVFLYLIGPILGISEDRPKHISLDVWVIDFYNANPDLQECFDKLEAKLNISN